MNGPLAGLILATAADARTALSRSGVGEIEPIVRMPDALTSATQPTGRDVAVLDPPSPPILDTEEALCVRASRRNYGVAPLPSGHLAAILEAWEEGATRLAVAGSRPTSLVVCRSVAGTTPGIYRSGPGAPGRLTWLSPLPDRLADTVLQAEFAAAPAIVVFAGQLEAATRTSGAHGHRLLHLQAGLAAHAAWVAAEQRLLAGCGFAGILPSFLRQAGIADGYRLTAVFAFALGARSDVET